MRSEEERRGVRAGRGGWATRKEWRPAAEHWRRRARSSFSPRAPTTIFACPFLSQLPSTAPGASARTLPTAACAHCSPAQHASESAQSWRVQASPGKEQKQKGLKGRTRERENDRREKKDWGDERGPAKLSCRRSSASLFAPPAPSSRLRGC
eukprot:3902153-Rhodomonas_salina.2